MPAAGVTNASLKEGSYNTSDYCGVPRNIPNDAVFISFKAGFPQIWLRACHQVRTELFMLEQLIGDM